MYDNITFSFSLFEPEINERWKLSGMSNVELGNWYARYLPNGIKLLREIFKGCKIIIYHNQILYRTYYGSVLNELDRQGIIKLIPIYYQAPPLCLGMMWRLKAIFDADTEYVFIRDLDYMPTQRERTMIDQFLESGKSLHCINDNENHNTEMMGGLVGFKVEDFKTLVKVDSWEEIILKSKYTFHFLGEDQSFYRSYLWTRLADASLCHRIKWVSENTNGTIVKDIPLIEYEDVDADLRKGIKEHEVCIGTAYGRVEKVDALLKDETVRNIEKKLNFDICGYAKDRRRVIFSITNNTDYSFLAPITALLWKEYVNFIPVIIIIGTYQEWHTDKKKRLIIDKCLEAGAEIHFQNGLDGFLDSTVAQVARAYPFKYGYNDETYMMSADADMLPMTKTWFEQADIDKLNLFFANAYQFKKYPMCYIGTKIKTWIGILGDEQMEENLINGLGKGKTDMTAWCYDEDMLGEKINNFSKKPELCNYIMRGSEPSGFPVGRVDRGGWIFDKNKEYIDCHSVRPAQYGDNWDKVFDLICHLLPERKEWFSNYREEFIS